MWGMTLKWYQYPVLIAWIALTSPLFWVVMILLGYFGLHRAWE